MYYPQTGRCISKYPIGFAGGVNVYRYAPSPVNWIDPLGLAAHRGRFQAQGKTLEESVSWDQDSPLSASDAQAKMEELKRKLSKKDLKLRQGAFSRAERWVERACNRGGIYAQRSQTFMVDGTRHERVDIEIRAGKAFVED
ncbi:RHS repeat-associated core domain-containing protein [Pseudomonas cremoricolorata]|uniref:RHS repeat-associated core domain-containing protein n=1 Tax=Pseudomonas cremoricolorata TaxID=157783 RepID=UPI003D335121